MASSDNEVMLQMSTIKKNSVWVTAGALLVIALGLLAMGFRDWSPPQETREVVLTGQGNAFFLAGDPQQRNPTLYLRKGQPVKLIVRNDDAERILHCFTIAGLDVKTSRNLSRGESEILSFTPGSRGNFAYACLMHPMMTGSIVVE